MRQRAEQQLKGYIENLLVYGNVKHLQANEQQHVENANAYQHRISPTIQWLIVFAIDLRRNDVRCLDSHVIQRRRNSPCPNGAGITTGDGYQDGVDVWIADQKRGDCPSCPMGGISWNDFKGDKKR